MGKSSKKIDYWDSIFEMPIYNWFKVEETNDVSYLLKYRIEIWDKKRVILASVWDKLVSQYIDEFGISDSFLQILLLKKAIATLKIREVLEGANHTTFIEIEEERLKELSNEGQKMSNYQVKAALEKHVKFHLDTKKITVVEYFYHLKNMSEEFSRGTKAA